MQSNEDRNGVGDGEAADRLGRLRFGRFEFDLGTLELKEGERHVPLPPKPSRALEMLLRRAGSLVTRAELQRHVWPNTIVEYDPGLNSCIRQLRAVLRDDAARPRFVETVPRRGYRFIATVERAAGSARWRGGYSTLLGAAVAALALAGGAWIWGRAEPAAAKAIRVAVLPPRLIGDAPRDGRFAAGLGEELLTALGRADPARVRVVSGASVARAAAAGGATRLRALFGADYVLEASVRPDGDGYKIATRLIDARRATVAWAGQHRTSAADGITAQERVTASVVTALASRLGTAMGDETGPLPRQPVRAAWSVARRLVAAGDAAELPHAVSLLRDVTRGDPAFGPGHLMLARALLTTGRLDEADAALARAALLLGPAADVLAERGRLRMRQWRLAEAGRDLARAAAARPGDPRLHHVYGYYLGVVGEHEEARREMAVVRRLDPASRAFGVGGLLGSWAGDPAYAIARCREALDVVLPRFRTAVHRCLLHNYAAMERWADAARHAEAVLRDAGAGDAAARMRQAGSHKEAFAVYLAWAAEDDNLVASQGAATHYARAVARAAGGDRAGALAALRAAFESGEPRLVEMGVEPRLAPLRNEVGYRSIARAIGLVAR